jgi:hypothetical protein
VDDTPATTTTRRIPVDQCPPKDNPTTSDGRLLPEKGRSVPAGGWLGSELLVVVPDSVDPRAVAVGTGGGLVVVPATLGATTVVRAGGTTDVGATTGGATTAVGATTGDTAVVGATTDGTTDVVGTTTGGTTPVVGVTTGGTAVVVGATTGGTTTDVGATTGGTAVVVGATTGGGELAAAVGTATGDGLTTPPDDESSGHVLVK